jgi:membrane protein implicated in regulation of membrane protease activity
VVPWRFPEAAKQVPKESKHMEGQIISETTPTAESPRQIPPAYIVLGVIVALLVVGLVSALVIWLAANFAPEIQAIRDVFIIALALQSCVFAVILVIMLLMLVRLVNMLEFEIKPILEKTNETVGMVRGTTTFVSKNVVTPVTKASSYAAGVRRGLKVLFGDPKKNLPD